MKKNKSMRSIAFTKMQALGNDFVIIEAITQEFVPTKKIIKKIADRHYGIGCDQLLIVEKPRHKTNDFFCRIFNADGGETGQCGNGMRCLAKFLIDKKLTKKKIISVETISGESELRIEKNDTVTVDMGRPIFDPKKIPIKYKQQALGYKLALPQEKYQIRNNAHSIMEFGAVSVGNPHAVVLVKDLDSIPVNEIGGFISRHEVFPKEINVEFMEVVTEDKIRLRVYERGTGETLACGSGACAAVVIGKKCGLLGPKVTVCMTGGSVTVTWLGGKDSSVTLNGGAQKVFAGTLVGLPA